MLTIYTEHIVEKGEIAHQEQYMFLLLATICCYLMLDFYVKRRTRFSLRDIRLFEIIEVEITRVDCIVIFASLYDGIEHLKERLLALTAVYRPLGYKNFFYAQLS